LPVQLLWLALCPRAPALLAGVFRPGADQARPWKRRLRLRAPTCCGWYMRSAWRSGPPDHEPVVSRDYRPLILLNNMW